MHHRHYRHHLFRDGFLPNFVDQRMTQNQRPSSIMALSSLQRISSYAFGLSIALLVVLFTVVKGSQDEEGSCSNNNVEGLSLFHFEHAGSTQDEAKRIVAQEPDSDLEPVVCVTATEQSNGRGTSGRIWMGARGNTFVTIGIRQSAWIATKLPLTLLPLQIGTIVAQHVSRLVENCKPNPQPFVTIKWPNDVLVDHQKIAGVLIESENGWFLVGIGVNVAYAPPVPTAGPNHGRQSTSLDVYCSADVAATHAGYEEIAHQLGVDMARDLGAFLDHPNPAQDVLDEWKQRVDWDMELVLRDLEDKTPVVPVDVHSDGRLLVRDRNGQERLVVSDYFI
jgi:BirA family biotin operon repressor/biotin-[acetyl-CoA-carboxylase] ligase